MRRVLVARREAVTAWAWRLAVALIAIASGMSGRASGADARQSGGVPRPFGSFIAVPGEAGQVLAEAYERAVGECMAERGFAYDVKAPRRQEDRDVSHAYGL